MSTCIKMSRHCEKKHTNHWAKISHPIFFTSIQKPTNNGMFFYLSQYAYPYRHSSFAIANHELQKERMDDEKGQQHKKKIK